ncbi:MAG: 4-(cytidine 5'-diphospho)-2-C-methyl-D-erythritol kinase [Gammaproteobacteria bacterium]|nr:4-(cytidine 5'-diphospho)-2-C-methyl-D-erythritol kinase [Gammaproteobacteria bacterium]MCP5200437.1 4-(cytidine 5'-diphospho)-2-C-methyl-D-erythritol kinase [Gammaproteobacteria bacterium]
MTDADAWPAPAKINLFLHVTGRRADGYHLLQTWFQFVDDCDWLDIRATSDGRVRRATALPGVAEDDDLVVRAARLLQQETGCGDGAVIGVDKRLPMGGGLGGGSSNAATVLVALNALWGLGLDVDRLAALGLGLGADVPVFVRGEAAWAEGVGEVLEPCPAAEGAVLVVTPDCAVSTVRVFTDPDLTRDTPAIKMHAFSLARSRNDCEPVTRRLYPEVGAALDWLAAFAPARMSGTGASVFAFFDDLDQARAVQARVPHAWRAHAGRRCNRSPLLDRLARQRGAG